MPKDTNPKKAHRRKTRPLTHNPVTRLFWLTAAMDRQGNRCHYCGRIMRKGGDPDLNPRLDHVLAISLGGRDIEENTLAACARCDTIKRNLPPEDFVDMMIKMGLWT